MKHSGVARKGIEGILDGVSAQHEVIAHDERRDHHRRQTAPAAVFGNLLVGGHRVGSGPAADDELRQHGRGAHQQNAGQVHKQVGRAAVGAGLVGKAPQIAQTHRGTRRRQLKAYACAEARFLFFHMVTPSESIIFSRFYNKIILKIVRSNNRNPIKVRILSVFHEIAARFFTQLSNFRE